MQLLTDKCCFLAIASVLLFASCKKEAPCAACNVSNQTPTAHAGNDTSTILPANTVRLNGSASSDPEGQITRYKWRKIYGPFFYTIADVLAAQTTVTDLVDGVYQFELNVTDAGGLSAADTVLVRVSDTNTGNSQWTRLEHLPAQEFFFGPRNYFDGNNFLMGIDQTVFAVSSKGNLWRYEAPIWSRVGTFPEQMNWLPRVFAINGKGYCMGNGHCWQYDPLNNQWTRKKDPPGNLAYPLVINSKAYLVDANMKLVAYDPSTDAYTELASLPDVGGNTVAGHFVLHGKGYYIGENHQTWAYDPADNSWQQKAAFSSAGVVNNMSSFALNNYGFIIGDLNGDSYNNSLPMKLWRYDPAQNEWKRFGDYPGDGYYLISTVSFDEVVYAGLGFNNGDFNAIDFWSFR